MRSNVFWTIAAIACGVRAEVFPVSPEEGVPGVVRAVAAANAAGGGDVRLANGIYRLEATLALTATNVTLCAAEKGGAVLSGARPVGGWQTVPGKPWLSARLGRTGYFRSLIVNGKYAPRAEFPGGGAMLQNANVWNVRWLSSIGNGWERPPTREESSTVFVKKGDLPEGFDPSSADIRVYHEWDNSLVRADKWIPERLRLELKEPCRFPPGSFNRHGYIVYNTKEGMLGPGNWYFDTTEGVLYYWPKSGETADSLKVEVPRLVRLLEFKGCEGVAFEGIVFENAMPPMERSTFSGVGISAAVTGNRSVDCSFRDCTFRNCGGISLRIANGRRLRLEGNTFERSGSCAIQADGRELFVSGNRILSSGRVFTSACACNISGRGVRFCLNEIDGAPYCGVVFNGEDNLFESNVVRNVMQSLNDGAAFYGMGMKTVFRGNRVFDNQPDVRGRHAFYFDEGGRDGLVVDNFVEGGFRSPVHNHFTYNIVVSNNVFRTPGRQGVSFAGSRWGTCVDNRFECVGGFDQMPSVYEVTNWSGNVFLENGVERRMELARKPVKRQTTPVPVPYTPLPPKVDGWVDRANWPGIWTYAKSDAEGFSLHGTPRMFRACHDGTNLYLAARAPHYRWEQPATNAASNVDWVRFRFANREVEIRADGTVTDRGSAMARSLRHCAGVEKTQKKGMGWYMTYQVALPLAELGVAAGGPDSIVFDFAIHDALTGETRHHNPTDKNATPSVFRVKFPENLFTKPSRDGEAFKRLAETLLAQRRP